MFRLIGSSVVFGFALYGLGKYLTRPSVKLIRLHSSDNWTADGGKDEPVKPVAD